VERSSSRTRRRRRPGRARCPSRATVPGIGDPDPVGDLGSGQGGRRRNLDGRRRRPAAEKAPEHVHADRSVHHVARTGKRTRAFGLSRVAGSAAQLVAKGDRQGHDDDRHDGEDDDETSQIHEYPERTRPLTRP
jgi:hypothetical protein